MAWLAARLEALLRAALRDYLALANEKNNDDNANANSNDRSSNSNRDAAVSAASLLLRQREEDGMEQSSAVFQALWRRRASMPLRAQLALQIARGAACDCCSPCPCCEGGGGNQVATGVGERSKTPSTPTPMVVDDADEAKEEEDAEEEGKKDEGFCVLARTLGVIERATIRFERARDRYFFSGQPPLQQRIRMHGLHVRFRHRLPPPRLLDASALEGDDQGCDEEEQAEKEREEDEEGVERWKQGGGVDDEFLEQCGSVSAVSSNANVAAAAYQGQEEPGTPRLTRLWSLSHVRDFRARV